MSPVIFPVVLVVFCSAFVTRPAYVDATCSPITPIPVDVDLDASLGLWYSYRSGPSLSVSNQTSFTNPISVFQSLGYLGGSTRKQAQSMEIQSRLPNATSCYYIYLQVNRTACGRLKQNYWIVGNPTVAGYEEKTTLYSDPRFIQILHKCIGTGCTSQNAVVHIRKKPSELSEEEVAAINSIIDITLAPYCLSHADLRLVGGVGPSTVCPYQDRPAEYLAELENMKLASKTECQLNY